ncbi:hypothetical protein HMPREF0083_01514 [Aneurinibacillus aneurinilyticus ATCC 12856]|uniref:Uncharacterized protein n=1 Tax=Aneurinibacillus aneurinilyticus ATCC 12856 TaxID=649747 RepID=U1X5Z2_ANEAE|nr:hypothetical protein HMPREF0083_01514 [Aneurinibacillus aneurinilyticus ATCC 12856]
MLALFNENFMKFKGNRDRLKNWEVWQKTLDSWINSPAYSYKGIV